MRELKENELKNVNGGIAIALTAAVIAADAACLGVMWKMYEYAKDNEYVNDGQAKDRNPDGGINGPGR